MQANEFDELIRGKFDQEELPYKPELWQQLSQQLPAAKEKKNRIGILWWQLSGIAAAVAVIVVSVINWPQPDKAQAITKTKKTESPSAALQNATVAASPVASTEPVDKKQHEGSYVRSTSERNNNRGRVFAQKGKSHEQAKVDIQGAAPAGEEKESIAGIPGSGFADKTAETSAEPVVAQKKKQSTPIDIYDPLLLSPPERTQQKTSFSFTGGVNYGSLNTGYMVGVTAQRNLGRKIYIEGNIGFVNGNADAIATSTASVAIPNRNTGLTPSSMDEDPSAFVLTETSVTAIAPVSLYYFQVAPVVGYNVYKGLSVGVGADFQRLFQNDESYIIKNEAGRLRNLTKLDVGITGKTEYQISKKIKAGVLYRNGLSNVISKNKLYLDRDYLQVQFKYTFIH